MKMKRNIRHLSLSLLFSTCILLSAPISRADLAFHVDINTASLVGNPSGPFSLDFQLSQGNGLSNTVTLSHFTFTGGGATGAPTLTSAVTGDLGSSVVLHDTGSAINEFYQGFTGSTTAIGFDVSTTLNASGGIPDAFTVAILDSSTFNIQTTSPGSGTVSATDYLVSAPIDVTTVVASAATYTSDVSGSTTPGVTATVTAVPEPSAYGFTIGLGALALLLARRAKARNA
ncbi:MAG: NF038129 family PEP-CTERM protein [Terrimicrobiaceae bacterium]|nr:NF038129 family PEP-CTERM protein [Terrimicrobiaceae bacterium]